VAKEGGSSFGDLRGVCAEGIDKLGRAMGEAEECESNVGGELGNEEEEGLKGVDLVVEGSRSSVGVGGEDGTKVGELEVGADGVVERVGDLNAVVCAEV
jgi:hypothetical protein